MTHGRKPSRTGGYRLIEHVVVLGLIGILSAIAESGATEPKDIGKVMGVLMKAHKADLDGNLTREIVQELLAP